MAGLISRLEKLGDKFYLARRAKGKFNLTLIWNDLEKVYDKTVSKERHESAEGKSLLLEEVKEFVLTSIVDRVDRKRLKDRKDPYADGWCDFFGMYRLGEKERVAKELIQAQDFQLIVLRQDDENLQAVAKINAKKHEEWERLKPYWPPGRTKKDAYAAYLKDHPEEVLPQSEAS